MEPCALQLPVAIGQCNGPAQQAALQKRKCPLQGPSAPGRRHSGLRELERSQGPSVKSTTESKTEQASATSEELLTASTRLLV